MDDIQSKIHWSHEQPYDANHLFVEAFREQYEGRYPSVYAAIAYDTLMAMDAAVRDADGVADKDALIQALENPSFESVRVEFSYGPNHYPIQNYFVRVVEADDEGVYYTNLIVTVLEQHLDIFIADRL